MYPTHFLISFICPTTSYPSTVAEPSLGSNSVQSMRYSDVFPAPSGPITPNISPLLTAKENSLNIAKEKAQAIFLEKPEAVIIASDTIVLKNDFVFGKPKDVKEARKMIEELSDSIHQVYTSIVVQEGNRILSDISVSDVYFLPIPKEDLEVYLRGSEWKDKAGAYAIQGWAARYIDKIDGDYYAIMGFPISKVNSLLKQVL